MKPQRSSFDFKLNPVAASVVLVVSHFAASMAIAGSGFGTGTLVGQSASQPIATYYANSPSGQVVDLLANTTVKGTPLVDPLSGLPATVDSGKALRKFVDTLPGIPGLNASGFLGNASTNVFTPGVGLNKVIPIAQPEKWVSPAGVITNDDYYEIAAVEFSEQMHSDLPAATHLRGYVQIVTPALKLQGITGVQLFQYGTNTPLKDAAGNDVYAVAAPSHLGPIIKATSGVPVRVKFTNYLPVGGKLFLPVDTTVTGAGLSGDGLTYYTENRAEIHLVGGEAPWISAGSPHQWVAPAGEAAAVSKGVSNQDVPDMEAAGAGSTTLYFPNKLSSRISFYHDRTSGLTRLNTYAGLEAGYLITDDAVDNPLASQKVDPVTQANLPKSLVEQGVLPADQIPLFLEDKTFVPQNIAQQDAKWDTAKWGKPGDLWYPHVYETNQDPNVVGGANPVGRWDYGPWFWPIFAAAGPLPDVSFTPEAYHDTPLVNGVAYPTLTVEPKAYRVRIVNGSSDRYFNLGWYLADTTPGLAPILDRLGNPTYDSAGKQLFFTNTEVHMVPADADVTGAPRVPSVDPTLVDLNGAAQYDAGCLCQYPNLARVQDANQFSGPNRAWPTDNRNGGAPDPLSVGPDFIQYGTDGGLLPSLVDVPSQPVTYESNRRSVTVSNVYGYGLLVGPSERADTVVDFAGFAGRTLILYNDAPAPFPFNDQRLDYFTNGGDFTAIGGAYNTQPGYGPNTRTVMQVVVKPNLTGAPLPQFDTGSLDAAVNAAYKASQPAPIVPQVAYNAAMGTTDYDVYAHVATGSVAQPNLNFSTTGTMTITGVEIVSSGGTIGNGGVSNPNPGSGMGYDPLYPPVVVFNDGACRPDTVAPAVGYATVDPASHQVTAVTLGVKGQAQVPTFPGYLCAPVVTFETPAATAANPAPIVGVGAQATVTTTRTQSIPVLTKSEQELFDNLGRYNATGGAELPFTQANIQTTIPLSYIDAPTDYIGDSETQIWKIVDNGLWTNSMHFDMVDVQLINRVGWDGTVKVPGLNEVGWKDTLRLNPLEDVIVAMRAKHPQVPFGLPRSQRMLDPSVPANAAGSNLGFMVDPNIVVPFKLPDGTNTPLTTSVNVTQNYDNEFVWSSAILSHSENDLMRPIVYQATVAIPPKPTLTGNGTVLSWSDSTPAADPATVGNPLNETGFTLTRSEVDANNKLINPVVVKRPANVTSYDDSTRDPAKTYQYILSVENARASIPSAPYLTSLAVPAVPAAPTATIGAGGVVTLTWPAAASANSYEVHAVINGADQVLTTTTNTSITLSGNLALPLGGVYDLSLVAVRSVPPLVVKSTSASPSTQVSLISNLGVPAPTFDSNTYQVSWSTVAAVAPTTAVPGYSVIDNGVTKAVAGTSYALTTGGSHNVQVAAVGTVWGGPLIGAYSPVQTYNVPVTTAPANLAFVAGPALSWTALPNYSYTVTQSVNGGAATAVVLASAGQTAPLAFNTAGSAYTYNVIGSVNNIASAPATITQGTAANVTSAVTTSSATLTIRMPAAATGATSFVVTRSLGANGAQVPVAAVASGGTAANGYRFTLTDTGLTTGTRYTYRVTPTVGATVFPTTTLNVRTN